MFFVFVFGVVVEDVGSLVPSAIIFRDDIGCGRDDGARSSGSIVSAEGETDPDLNLFVVRPVYLWHLRSDIIRSYE